MSTAGAQLPREFLPFVQAVRKLGGRRAYGVLALSLLVAATEGIGLLLLVPLLSLAGADAGGNGAGGIGSAALQVLESTGVRITLPLVLGVYVLVVSARVLLQRSHAVQAARLGVELVHRLRTDIYRAVTGMEWSAFVARRAADLTHALTLELDRVATAATQLPQVVTQLLLGALYAAVAFRVSPMLAAISCATGFLLLLALRGTHAAAHRAGEQLSIASADMTRGIHEHAAALKVARAYGAEERNRAAFVTASRRVGEAYLAFHRVHTASAAVFGVATVVLLAVLVHVAVTVVHLSAAGILLLLFVFSRLVPRFSDLQRSWQYLVSSLPAFGSIQALLEDARAHAEKPALAGAPLALRKAIEVRDIWFRYPGAADRWALEGASLVIPRGGITAVVGPSGAGKSTLADILLGVLTPARGTVLVDGVALTPGDRERWRGSIAYVPQDAFLLHDTIRENLRWAVPGASDEQMWAALRDAAADGFVARSPAGLDTIVGDRGLLLSGGERQRIALARAFLRKPSLLVLDEATSSLDQETERQMLGTILALRGRTTVLMITHRLAAVRAADNICVLSDGVVAEAGTWHGLTTDANGVFSRLLHEIAPPTGSRASLVP